MTHDRPPIETATDPIRSTSDMRQRWRALMGELGFGQSMLWVGFVGPDRRMPKLLIDLPRPASPRSDLVDPLLDELVRVLDDMEPGTTVAFLLTGPGHGPLSTLHRRWATELTAAAAQRAVPLKPIFGANDDMLIEVDSALKQAG
ncbi:hypothetical protein [Mycobacterium sp. OTB74]|jgi:hypothetical protein|uniref:hypothetical protein n=1 Tax=Mycobacterium sp. OTB74 TaxID=1853452 RepID=UPI002476A187|nr:hypothetical protein [Mycobacterium sp. OTB74]MDH6246191.1 hypothetical protein [Mycobacterium sp. OTB74]